MVDLAARLAEHAAAVETALLAALPPDEGAAERLHAAMRYASLGGGKRLRPFLVAAGAELFEVPGERSLRAGLAVELIHGYSLVHDDLPAMDDAATRRGRPTVHCRFDDATAVLAGDALQALAFEVLTDPATHPDPAIRCVLVRDLAIAAGAAGMCGGQMIDLEAEGRTLDVAQVLQLQRLKTGALFRFSCLAGATLGAAPPPAVAALEAFAEDLGLAFQIKDDLLDVEGDAALAGKDLGRDQAAGKATVVALLGKDAARARLETLRASAHSHLDKLDRPATLLRAAFDFVLERSS